MSESLHRFAQRGPYPVGVATVEVVDAEEAARRVPLDVWYPAASGAEASPPASHPLNRPHDAREGAPAAAGRFPLVGFSHGNSGLRRQSTFLTTHLASWGLVVVAPDHVGNTFFEMVQIQDEAERKRVHFEARARRPRDLLAALDATAAGGPWPEVDRDRAATLGHSFGGWTALKLPARDPRVRAVCGLAPASEPFVGRKAFDPGELPFDPALPVLIVAGIDDVLVDLETSVRPLFERVAEPRALVGIEGADHFHFCDGIELLHGIHESNPREAQPRPTKPYAQQLPEARMHRVVRAVVTRFLYGALVEGEADPCASLAAGSIREIDPALRRLENAKSDAA